MRTAPQPTASPLSKAEPLQPPPPLSHRKDALQIPPPLPVKKAVPAPQAEKPTVQAIPVAQAIPVPPGVPVARAVPVTASVPVAQALPVTDASFAPSARHGSPSASAMAVPMNIAPPFGALAPASTRSQPSYPVPAAQDMDLEEDEFGEDPIPYAPTPTQPLPTPQTVPTTAMPPVSEARADRGPSSFVMFLLTLTLLLSLGAVYFTGVADGVLSSIGIPTWADLSSHSQNSEGIPAIFTDSPAQTGQQAAAVKAGAQSEEPAQAPFTLSPASPLGVPKLEKAEVLPATAKSPTQLTFSLYTNTATKTVKLLKENNDPFLFTGSSAPVGDGLLWTLTVNFEEPFHGKVLISLRDEQKAWITSPISLDVDVQ